MTASTIASGRNGTTRKNSSIAKSTVATFPFTYPATSPTVEPITTATTVAKMPIKSDTREPHTNCAKTSRPMSSVPSKNCALGEAKSGLLRPAAANSSDRSAINGAHNATNPNPSSTNRLTKPARSWRSSRHTRANACLRRLQVMSRGEIDVTGSFILSAVFEGRVIRTSSQQQD